MLQGLIGVLLVGAIAVVCLQRVVLRRSSRSRATGGGNAFAALDELFSPARHVAAIELQAQEDRGPVTPVPDGGLPQTRDGSYVIRKRRAALGPNEENGAGPT